MPFTKELLQYQNDVFVETGSHHGDTINYVSNNDTFIFPKIISLELSPIFVDMCNKRFASNKNIHIHNANSKNDLYNIIKDINVPITFWLDSHWSGCPDVGCDKEVVCPIIHELNQIKLHSIKNHTIIIDDIRLMNGSNNRYKGFPINLNDILKTINEINPNYVIKYYDDETSKNDVLVAFISK